MPARQNPFARLLRGKRRRSPGSLGAAARECWLLLRVCGAARDAAMQEQDMETLYRFVGLEGQLLKTYAALTVPSEIEERLKAVEARRLREGDDTLKADNRWDYRDLLD